MVELIRNPESYQPMLEGWRDANRKAKQAESDASAMLDAATKKEQVARTERGLADERIKKAGELEARLNELAAGLAARESAVEAREQAAAACEDALEKREGEIEARLTALRQDLSDLRAL